MAKAVHSWDISTGICGDCGAEYTPELSDDSEFLMYAGLGFAAVIAIPLLILLFIKIFRRKRY
jgi:hypothetical protein